MGPQFKISKFELKLYQKLIKIFSFALFGCFAYAGAPLLDTEDLESRDYIQLYSNDSNTDIDSCPNENAKKVFLKIALES